MSFMKLLISARAHYLLLLFFSAEFTASAPLSQFNSSNFPTVRIYGKLQHAESLQAIEFGTVALYALPDSAVVQSALSTASGDFVMKYDQPGTYFLRAQSLGYAPFTTSSFKLTTDIDSLNLSTIPLQEQSQMVEEVEVVAQSSDIEFKSDKKVLNLSSDITNAGGTAADALEFMPSVETDLEGEVSIRGSKNFMVLIDGKPSPLSGNEALQQMPVELIKKLELITNPSAKYTTEGGVGVLNIVTHRNKRFDFSLRLSGNTDFRQSAVGSGMLSKHLSEQTRIGIRGSVRQRVREGTSFQNRETFAPAVSNMRSQGSRFNKRSNNRVGIFLSHDFSKQANWEIQYRFGQNHNERNRQRVVAFSAPDKQDFERTNLTDNDVENHFHNFSTSYEIEFDTSLAHSLSVHANASLRHNEQENLNRFVYRTQGFQDGFGRGTSDFGQQNGQVRVDYEQEVGTDLKYEVGYQLRHFFRDKAFLYEEKNPESGALEKNNNVSNSYDFKRDIHALYASFSGKVFPSLVQDLYIKAGLRAAYTDRLISLVAPRQEFFAVERFDLFPSVFFSKTLSTGNSLNVSYSRRINRPRDRYLNPFRDVSNPLQITEGNPGLLAENLHIYECGFVRSVKLYTFSLEGYYREKRNKIERLQTHLGGDVFSLSYFNTSRSYEFGLEGFQRLKLLKWLHVQFNGSLSDYVLEGANVPGGSRNRLRFNLGLRLNFMFPTDTRLQLRSTYRSKSIGLQSVRDAVLVSHMGLSQSFWKRSLRLNLNFRNFLNAYKYSETQETEAFRLTQGYEPQWPIIRLNVSYVFNQVKTKRSRSMGESEGGEGDYEEF